MRVIAFALWGSIPKYLVGAVRNAQLAPHLYPGWQVRYYVHRTVPEGVCRELEQRGGRLYPMELPDDWRGAFARFFAIGDPDVEIAVFRDCDSRLSLRESAAVARWLDAGATLHVMRDHPGHRNPILAGLWGLRCDRARWIAHGLEQALLPDRYAADEDYLARVVWPKLRDDCVEHDEVHGGNPFPLPRLGDEFVGQVFDEHDMPCESYSARLRAALGKRRFLVNDIRARRAPAGAARALLPADAGSTHHHHGSSGLDRR